MARVNEGSHSLIYYPHVHPAVAPQPQRLKALWSEFISRPTKGRRLSGAGWDPAALIHKEQATRKKGSPVRRACSRIPARGAPDCLDGTGAC